jgi:hypothetical protein
MSQGVVSGQSEGNDPLLMEERKLMASNLFKTTTSKSAPLDASDGDTGKPTVSDFITIQSLTNFSAMTGAITAAWGALKTLNSNLFSGVWVAYTFALIFGLISLVISLDGLKKDGKIDLGNLLAAIFIALVNSLILASAVVGASGITGLGKQ